MADTRVSVSAGERSKFTYLIIPVILQVPGGGRDPRVPVDSYRPPQAGQPPANKVLSRHGLLSSWENLKDIDDARKTAVINDELRRLNVDIAALQETRLADSGTLKEQDYTFYWQGKGSNEPREHGVGFAVKNTLLRMVEPGSNGSARLLTLRLNTTKGPITLVSVYAPTLAATPEVKDEFYENLTATIRNIPSDEQLVLLGDFNARVGDDHESWPACLGKFGVGKMNENGQRALEFCAYHNLCITNSYFQTKPQHKVSWRHPRSKHWHQLDLILTRRTSLKNMLLTRAYQSADCDTDHSLVCCNLSTGKAPGSDAIPPDLLKHCKTVLLLPLHELLCQCWKEGAVPQDMRDSKIVTLYKNKGERSDCNNYRGISLLSVVGKVYTKVVLARLQRLAERVYPESQCGFRANRSTIDMIFSLRQLQEKCREQNMPLYIAFIDLTKAFDMVSRDGLFKILPKIGCPPKLQSLIESFHTNMKGTVLYSGNLSEPFDIRGGVKQGCVMAPTLFGIFFALLLKQAFGTATEGIYLRTRSDGRLFNLNRLKAKTKVREALSRDLLFADDAGLAAHTEQGLQSLMDRFSRACNDFGLIISLKKTEVLGQDVEAPPAITIGDYELKAVNHFTYLGSTASNNLSLDKEIDKRIGKAATTLARLTTRVWENPKLSVKTKMAVYNACVLSTLLYGSETWSTYAKQENRLNAFHMRCMRRILGISWKDKVTNTEVLSRAGLPTMFTLLRQRRLRWLGHVRRMEDGRIPKDLLYGELISGKRRTGRPQLRFKDVCKRDLKALDINTEHWEDLASDRSRWRCTLFRQLKSGEIRLMHSAEEKRIRRKELCNRTESAYRCDFCGRDCHSRIGLFSHSRCCRAVVN
ncbi:uncharacterized protein [Branchiostoma lanceolatum]|uniref:uncharacterized protein n=1 Tax=Branchiostoma lanceolatum TaxID=7740 RepID=UPI00345189EF